MSKCNTCQRPARLSVHFKGPDETIAIGFCANCGRKPSCHFFAYVKRTGELPFGVPGLMRKARQRGWIKLNPNKAKDWIVDQSHDPIPISVPEGVPCESP